MQRKMDDINAMHFALTYYRAPFRTIDETYKGHCLYIEFHIFGAVYRGRIVQEWFGLSTNLPNMINHLRLKKL